jgi:hypothetical protein
MKLLAALSLAALALAPSEASAQMMMQGGRMIPVTVFRGGGTNVSSPQQNFNRGITGQVSPSAAAFAALYPGLNPSANPGSFAGAGAGTVPTSALASLSGLSNPYASLAANPYGASGTYSQSPYGGSGYGTNYYESPEGGFLRGTADLMSAQGRWMASLQQASLLQEQNRQASIETRRKSFDEYVHEREKTPTFEEERERVAQLELTQSLNDPPTSEIWSGRALNAILADLAKRPADDASGQTIPLDEDLLRHINLTAGHGSAGVLKNEGRLSWPLALLGDAYRDDRELLNLLALGAINQSTNGAVDSGTLKMMSSSVQKLHQQLAADIKDLTASQYIEASRFLGQLDDALKVLARPNAANCIALKTAQVRTVADLVKHMISRGLTFAPAVSGDGAAYVALHRALVAYDASLKPNLAAER